MTSSNAKRNSGIHQGYAANILSYVQNLAELVVFFSKSHTPPVATVSNCEPLQTLIAVASSSQLQDDELLKCDFLVVVFSWYSAVLRNSAAC